MKHKLPAGDQFWKSSHQYSIFGHIGDQWVAISSPVVCAQQVSMYTIPSREEQCYFHSHFTLQKLELSASNDEPPGSFNP